MKLTALWRLAVLVLPATFAAAEEEADPKARIELREKILAAAPDQAQLAISVAGKAAEEHSGE